MNFHSRIIRAPAVVLILAALFGAESIAAVETVREHPDETLGARTVEVVALINEGDPARLLRLVRERYGESMMRGMTAEGHAEFLENVHEGRSPIELCCYRISDRIPENMAVAVLYGTRNDTWSEMQIRFDDAGKITSLMMISTKPPLGLVELERLDDAGVARQLDAYLTGMAAAEEFTGTVLLARDGRQLFAGAYGLANREHEVPNKIDTRFNLGSMNKMFTAVAAAQLVERGKLSFDAPIGKYLPHGWVRPEVGRKVRIRHLLNHTSGLGDYLEPFIEQAHFRFSDLEDYKEIVVQETLRFEPGSRWSYSNTGFLVLGVIVAEVSGQGYFEYIRKNIYEPAGMNSSDSFDRSRAIPNLADGYWNDEGQWTKNIFLLSPRGTSAGGGYSTVGDLLAFDTALRSNKLLTAKMRDLLFTPDAERNSPAYGYGFMISAMAPDREVGHGGTHYGVSARLSMFLDSGYSLAVLCNGPGAPAVYGKVLELIERAK